MSRGERFEPYSIKTPVTETGYGRPTNNPPCVPQIETTYMIIGRKEGKQVIPGGQSVRVTKPLIEHTVIGIGGGRPIGGGTSRESLRRARQKSRKKSNGR